MTGHHACHNVFDSALSMDEIVAVVSLLNTVWPSEDMTLPELVEAFPEVRRRHRLSGSEGARPSLRHLVWDSGELIAHALTFERRVSPGDEHRREITVMALSGVCVAPSHRGKGLGAKVVRRAFERVDSGEFPVSLFQTDLPSFYHRLGAKVVGNRFVNATSEVDPNANPWNDQWIMIYPEAYKWPDGAIDLNGPGY